MAPLCEFLGPNYLLFSENVPPLVYYSHIPVFVLTAIIAAYIYVKGRNVLLNKIFFYTLIPFFLWVFLDSVFWASNKSDLIMFVWSLQILFEPFVFAGSLYLTHVLINKRDVSFNKKLTVSLLILPLIVLVPTKYILSGFNITACLANETLFSYYSYVIELIFTIWIVLFVMDKYRQSKNLIQRREILTLGIGIVLFLLAFDAGNLIGSFSENWNLAQVGLLGMPILLGFLSYAVVNFKTFNLKIIGANLLVITLWILIASTLIINNFQIARLVLFATLFLSIVFGTLLIKAVRREVLQREEIELLASNLKQANTRLRELDRQKSEFVSFASHQLRSPITAMKGYSSLLLDGDYGALTDDQKMAVDRIYQSSRTLASVVDDYLNISRIELGTMKYTFTKLDFNKMVSDTIAELTPTIEKTGISFSYIADKTKSYLIDADPDKFKQVILNLIDNALKYTQKGSIGITLVREPANKFLLTVKDTGIGISKETLPKLFQKFSRANNANEMNIRGTGLGLFVAADIVKAHYGRVWAESEGEGKGSQFFIEIPEAK